jgi:beta-lactamase regulating signal transducer with metallopeptidase domain
MSDDTPQGDSIDLRVMQLMSGPELERYTEILETIIAENVWLEVLRSAGIPLTPAERDAEMAHVARLESAISERATVVNKYADERSAIDLGESIRQAIETLWAVGQLIAPMTLGRFWDLVYSQLLRDQGETVKTTPRALKEVTKHLPEIAQYFRESEANPGLAEFLDSLTD